MKILNKVASLSPHFFYKMILTWLLHTERCTVVCGLDFHAL